MRPRPLTPSLLVLAIAALVGAACSDDSRVATEGADPPSDLSGSGEADQRYEGAGLVLQAPGEQPVLCLGGATSSLPPQCGGPEVIGWDWDEVDGAQHHADTTWGSYRVVGTYDGATFTLAEAPRPDDGSGSGLGGRSADLTPPCDPPEGGWQPVDPERTGEEALGPASAYAQAQPSYAGLWVDSSVDPEEADRRAAADEGWRDEAMVLVVLFTDDLEAHEAELRALWGGPLCVAPAERTEAELRAIQAELNDLDGMLWSSDDVVGNRVMVGVTVDDGLQASLDERYGEGVVQVDAALRRLD